MRRRFASLTAAALALLAIKAAGQPIDPPELLRHDGAVSGEGRPAIQPASAEEGRTRVRFDRALLDLPLGSEVALTLPRLGRKIVVLDNVHRHPSGSRTWAGHIKDAGADFRVMLTAGERGGVFGRVLTPDGEFAVESHDGTEWLIDETAARRTRMRETGSDARQTPQAPGIMLPSAPLSMPSAASSPAKPTTVDLLILYTPGMATRYGTGLVPLIDSLVAYANQAYLDSRVNMRMRAVHRAEVNYPDNGPNSDALVDARAGTLPAFSGVEALRATWGADIVALLRPFSQATHGGCGQAYIPIATNPTSFNARYSYSVASVGTDVGGTNFFCHDSSLAHETGHNLGSTHDRAHLFNAHGYFPYSYGYGVEGSFGTIMSYIHPTVGRFSNPSIVCSGAIACGIANSEDNARSLNELAPQIAAYQPTVVPLPGVRGDLEDNARADIVWRHAGDGQNVVWLMNGASLGNSAFLPTAPDPQWKIAGIGDLNADGRADIVWRHGSSGQNVVWLMNGAAVSTAAFQPTVTDPAWKIVAVADFNGDGRADLFWRHDTSGQNVVWLMNGASVASWAYAPTVVDPNWRIAGSGDFDRDGKSDLLWRNGTTGQNVAWLMNGSSLSTAAFLPTVLDTGWKPAGIGDFNADGKADIFWRHDATGQNVVWLMDGTTRASWGYAATVSDAAWKVVAVGDYDADGRVDVFWRHDTTGQNVVWLMNGIGFGNWAFLPTVPDSNWKAAGGR